MTNTPERVLNVPALLAHLWQRRLVFLAIFLVVVVAGSAWAFTRPRSHEASQLTVIAVPTVQTEAESTQQAAILGGMSTTYLALLKDPLVGAPVLEKHPDLRTLEVLTESVKIVAPSPFSIQVSASNVDPDKAVALVRDVSTSLAENAPEAFADNPPHLQLKLTPLDDIAVKELATGRLSMLAVVGFLALMAATLGAAVWPRRR